MLLILPLFKHLKLIGNEIAVHIRTVGTVVGPLRKVLLGSSSVKIDLSSVRIEVRQLDVFLVDDVLLVCPRSDKAIKDIVTDLAMKDKADRYQ